MDSTNQRTLTVSQVREATAKNSIIILSHNPIEGYPVTEHTHYLPYGDYQRLTVKMAQTFGDLAAVILVPSTYEQALHTADFRRIRQLTNAEGAMMIWDELDKDAKTENYRELVKPDIFLREPVLQELNSYETEFVRAEIFTNKTYLKHGLEITNDSIIVDIGANIGLFILFAKSIAPDCQIYAFEPAKDVFPILKENTKFFNHCIKLFNEGVGQQTGEKSFTYYPGYSVISGFYADLKADKAVILAGEQYKKIPASEEVINSRFEQQRTYSCSVVSLSDFISCENLHQIDFLKVDAEKSEMQILDALSEADWKKVKQIVVEVHGVENHERLRQILEQNGFSTASELGLKTNRESIFTLYGKK